MPAFPNLAAASASRAPIDNGSRPAITDRNNFDPRVGRRLERWTSKTVVHGGFGVFHHPGAQYGFENATAGSRRITNALVTQPNDVTPLFNLSDPFPDGLLPPSGTSQGLSTLLGQTSSASSATRRSATR